MQVQDSLDNYAASREVKSHIGKRMHTLFNQAIRWELLKRNPISLVRQSSKRLKSPRVLTPEEFKKLMWHADIRTTLDLYTQAVSEEKRVASTKVASALWVN